MQLVKFWLIAFLLAGIIIGLLPQHASAQGVPTPPPSPTRPSSFTPVPGTPVPNTAVVSGDGRTPTSTAIPATPPRLSPTPTPASLPATGAASATATRPSAIVATATLPASPTPRATPFPIASGGLAGKHVVVDPGHGGRDPGAVYHGLHEADVNLAVALELRSLLEQAGATVTMTRSTAGGGGGVGNSTSTDRDLQARVDIANRAAADLFLSIHGNA
ncbi:MAG TPA: N-acetylmuramoyl-L-alanine amidase, partial [Chloroflexota bacterium]|nr:N-acetylmuramoyl-L-alanine amidase [Chloroflexota bacterium]